jgi:homoserine kinase type II
MAVFTEVSFTEATTLLTQLAAGTLLRLEGISSGIENTNYFADTSDKRLVITLFERLERAELPFYLKLMQHLAQRGLPVPCPVAAASGELLHTLSNKPAAVTPRLPGAPVLEPSIGHCKSVATTLAQLHIAGRDYPHTQPSTRGLPYWRQHAPRLAPLLSATARQLLEAELAHQEQLAASKAYKALPRGATHGDLFRDNVLFDADQLTGLLDFYFAATDTFLYDIAVCLNDWCISPDGDLFEERTSAFVAAYDAARPLLTEERQLLPDLLRAAALRFWISRLVEMHNPRDASLLQPKDPAQYERILRRHASRVQEL